MQTIEVSVKPDYLANMMRSKSLVGSVAELIWNCLDADSEHISIRFTRNKASGVEEIIVEDDGHGIRYEDVREAFGNLGESKKRGSGFTPRGRIMHGKQGKGRFHAFALGTVVTWQTRYVADGEIREYSIKGRREKISKFDIEDPERSSIDKPGTTVRIEGVDRPPGQFDVPTTKERLTQEFALYLRQYKQVEIVYDSVPLDPSTIEANVAEYDVSAILENGAKTDARLTVVEWTIPTERMLYLCDEHGFTLSTMPVRIQAPGFVFTAHLWSSLIREVNEKGLLCLEEMHPDLRCLLEATKNRLKDHFRKRAAEDAAGLVELWKKEKVYPYEGNPANPIEEAERQVFDVIALNVNEYLPDFGESSPENRKMSFTLIRNAIRNSPKDVQAILNDVLNLPTEKQAEFAELLERTSLEAIINASKTVADRLDFLQGLKALLFDQDVKKKAKERAHLHRIVADKTWLFGEQFNLTVSDRTLTTVLKEHRKACGIEDIDLLDDEVPVVREDGSEGRVDLMFSRSVPQSKPEEREYLVVELKRPGLEVGPEELDQIKSYADAVAGDKRFLGTPTRWEWWLLANSLSPRATRESNQSDRAPGLLEDWGEYKMRIWVRPWGQVIRECEARLSFFRAQLRYDATEETGWAYLRRVHEKYLPSGVSPGQ